MPDPENWSTAAGTLVYRRDFDHVVWGFVASSSAYDGRFAVYEVLLPLAPPTGVVDGSWAILLNPGALLGPGVDRSSVDVLIGSKASRPLPEEERLDRVVSVAASLDAPALHEAAAYALLWSGAVKSAKKSLERYFRLIRRSGDNRDFVLDANARVESVRAAVAQGDLASAQSLVRSFETETVASLGLQLSPASPPPRAPLAQSMNTGNTDAS